MNSLEQLEHLIKTLGRYEIIEIKRDKEDPDKVIITTKSSRRESIDVPYSEEA